MGRRSIRCIALIGLCAVLVQSARAQATDPQVIKDVRYATVGDHELLLDLYLPKAKKPAESPLIVWVHGGAWRRGSKASMPLGWLVENGYAVASIDYRLSPVARFPAQVHDCKAAIRFLRANAKKYGYNADRIGIAGSSAGGHLVALVGTTNGHARLEGSVGDHLDQSSDVEAIIDYYGPTNFLTILKQSTPHGLGVRIPALQLLLGNQPENVPELAKLASPVEHVDAKDPPLLLVHGDQDPQVPINQSHELHGKYKELGLDAEFEVVHGGVHGGKPFFDEQRRKLAEEFFAKHLKVDVTAAANSRSATRDLADGNVKIERRAKNTQRFVENHCLGCHSGSEAESNFDLEAISALPIDKNLASWEQVVRKLRARQMPPVGMDRPSETEYESVLESLEGELDQIAKANPKPGRTETFRRLTRVEYQNAIRDLLAIEIDAAAILPRDESSQGFDNITVGELSPTLLNRYVTAAQKIARLAVGRTGRVPNADTIRIRPDITQEKHVAGLPLGTRGGAVIPYTFPADGEYEIRVRLARDRNEKVEGLGGRHQFELLLDKELVESFEINRPKDEDFSKVDQHLEKRITVAAGMHKIGATFVRNSDPLLETKRQPYQSRFNFHRHPRTNPAVYQVSITGPLYSSGPGNSPSRQRVFGSVDSSDADESKAKEIIASLARRAWRRPVSAEDVEVPLGFFQRGNESSGFDAGIEEALSAILVSPHFLFRVETAPSDAEPESPYRISDLELASRLSFFIWSSIPDDELIELAERGELSDPETLKRQVDRMLVDPRSSSLVSNFAGQWLYLRNLESAHPNGRLFPDFDHNLRDSMRRETELFFESVMRDDRSVLDLLKADYTFLNERLAKHYGISGIYGSRFRRVDLDSDSHRGGLLRHASILTVTSYATRTSPVIRGHWILKNLIGNPPPPPPPDVPDLKDNTVEASLPLRARLAQHRADPNCAGCHNLMDPVGFALENFDAIGRWRELETDTPIDASGGLPDGSEFTGVAGLEKALIGRPELFVGTLTEKLMTYALGRGVDHRDAPAIREIMRAAKQNDYRFSSLVRGIATSTPFLMRTAE